MSHTCGPERYHYENCEACHWEEEQARFAAEMGDQMLDQLVSDRRVDDDEAPF